MIWVETKCAEIQYNVRLDLHGRHSWSILFVSWTYFEASVLVETHFFVCWIWGCICWPHWKLKSMDLGRLRRFPKMKLQKFFVPWETCRTGGQTCLASGVIKLPNVNTWPFTNPTICIYLQGLPGLYWGNPSVYIYIYMPVVIFANIHPPAKSKSGNFITETFEKQLWLCCWGSKTKPLMHRWRVEAPSILETETENWKTPTQELFLSAIKNSTNGKFVVWGPVVWDY